MVPVCVGFNSGHCGTCLCRVVTHCGTCLCGTCLCRVVTPVTVVPVCVGFNSSHCGNSGL